MDHVEYETNVYDYNGSDYYFNEMHDGFLEHINPRVITYALFLDLWTLITNIVVVFVSFAGKNEKLSGYDAQLVNLCVSNLIIATFVIPLTIHHMFGSWNLGELMCELYVAADVIVPFTSILIIIMLTIDRMVAFSHPNLYDCMFETSCCKLMIVLPWLIAIFIIVPLWISASMPYDNKPGECIVMINKEVAVACPIVTFFIPCAILLALIISRFLQHYKYMSHLPLTSKVRENRHSYEEDEDSIDTIGTSVFDIETNAHQHITCLATLNRNIATPCLLSGAFCLLWLPYHLQSIRLSYCNAIYCVPSPEMIQLVTWLGTSTAGIIPLIILVDRFAREKTCRCCASFPVLETYQSNVTVL